MHITGKEKIFEVQPWRRGCFAACVLSALDEARVVTIIFPTPAKLFMIPIVSAVEGESAFLSLNA